MRIYARPLIFILLVVSLYALLRLKRDHLVDFVVPLQAASRFIAAEPFNASLFQRAQPGSYVVRARRGAPARGQRSRGCTRLARHVVQLSVQRAESRILVNEADGEHHRHRVMIESC